MLSDDFDNDDVYIRTTFFEYFILFRQQIQTASNQVSRTQAITSIIALSFVVSVVILHIYYYCNYTTMTQIKNSNCNGSNIGANEQGNGYHDTNNTWNFNDGNGHELMGILINIMPIKLGIQGNSNYNVESGDECNTSIIDLGDFVDFSSIEDTKAHNYKSAREIPAELNDLATDLLLSEEFGDDESNTSNKNSNELNNDENNKDKVKNKGNDDSMIVMI